MNGQAGRIDALADDLSGAAETAAALVSATGRQASVQLWPRSDGNSHSGALAEVRCFDLHLRGLSPARAAEVLKAATRALAKSERLFMKIDSLYRGHVSSQASAMLTDSAEGALVVFAPSLPANGRTLVNGQPYVANVPLPDSAAAATWAHESGPPPRHVGDLLQEGSFDLIPLDVVRSLGLAETIQRAARRRRLAVCDAATEADLDAVVEATWGLTGVRYVGSGGLAGAIGRRQAMDQETRASTVVPVAWETGSPKVGRLLVVVGSAEASARIQVAELVELGVPVVISPPDEQADLIRGAAEKISFLMADRGAVAVVVPQTIIPGASETIAGALAQAVISSLALLDDGTTRVGLVLIGGHTGRTVLDALETDALAILGEVHRGAVLSRANDGRLVTTRPGSFGGPDSLCRIVAALTTSRELQVIP